MKERSSAKFDAYTELEHGLRFLKITRYLVVAHLVMGKIT